MNIQPPVVASLDQILPEEPLLMMGAGPVPIPARVARANSIVINHLGDTMSQVIDQVKTMSRYVFQTESRWVMGVAGPGSAAMEMAVANLMWPGTRVLSICNGYFSHRLSEMACRVGADVETLEVPEKQAADPEQVRERLEHFRPEVLTIVQGETSNTVCNASLQEIARIAREYGCLVVVDAVCTLSTMPLEMDEWGIDAVITGGQKGLSSIPGFSLLAFSEQAWQRVSSRTAAMPHWCLDARLAEQFWHNGSYHYTAPVPSILALHEALNLICSETLPARFDRHLRCSRALQRGLEAMGMTLFAPQASRLNSVVGINLPDEIPGKKLCDHISMKYRVEVSGSFGLPIVRIGQMGEQSRDHHLFRTLHAFGSTMKDLGVTVDLPAGVAELEAGLLIGE